MGLLGLTSLQFKGKSMDQYIVENPAAVVLDTLWDQVEGIDGYEQSEDVNGDLRFRRFQRRPKKNVRFRS